VHRKYSNLTKNQTVTATQTLLLSSDFETPDVTEIHAGAEYNLYSWKSNPLFIPAGVYTDPDHLTNFTGRHGRS